MCARTCLPPSTGWRRGTPTMSIPPKAPDDMPAHIRTMLSGVSLSIPVVEGQMVLGTWQGIYLVEHRDGPQTRDLIFHLIGA